ncbi:MAG: glycine--tRNA ligase [bacterium]
MLESLDPIVNLMKRRGFLFQSAEIYGGAGGILDLGPLGVELNNNIKQLWWQRFIRQRDDMVGLDSAILTPYAVLKASGHVDSFSDPLIECGNCHIRLRADHYMDEPNRDMWIIRWRDEAMKNRGIGEKKATEEANQAAIKLFEEKAPLVCPNCGEQKYGEPRQFNMMFQTNMGAVVNEGSVAYLRPETCQGIFVNFKNVLDTSRRKVPFGIGQIGKAFRNEITIGNSLFRVREFEQAEIEYFVKPGEDAAAHDAWLDAIEAFLWNDIGIAKENLHRLEHPKESLSHYSSRTVDIEYNYPFGGFAELWGCANRTDYDLKQHQEHSGKDMTYFDEETRERYIPYVIEPSVGLGRLMLTILVDAYKEYPQGRDGKSGEMETVLHISKKIAPVKVAVLPLMKKDGMGEKAREIHEQLKQTLASQYDESGAIGRRYRRQDEIGTPYCVTVDYQTLEDGTVTVRDRDSMEQNRVKIEDLEKTLIF